MKAASSVILWGGSFSPNAPQLAVGLFTFKMILYLFPIDNLYPNRCPASYVSIPVNLASGMGGDYSSLWVWTQLYPFLFNLRSNGQNIRMGINNLALPQLTDNDAKFLAPDD
jgi:hypothetical protein